ncbi:PHKG1 [Cordylochernes scorpioides]|uniref:PHKG1 n=1 Tax=Cordylochernes scorpioides TaxID=51811 RepID=A0ABY6JYJ4_9ARAC|nr:PHKG1 [Cordylochernes scorpioides]
MLGVRTVMKQLLEAIAYIHSKNVVHRDIKVSIYTQCQPCADVRDVQPENILLDDNLGVKLTDFGFATVLYDNQRLTGTYLHPVCLHSEVTGELCGTMGYLSPELLRANMYDNAPGYGKEADL